MNNNNNFVTTKRPWFTTLICLFFLLMPLMIVGYVFSLFNYKYTSTWEPNYDDDTKINRTKVRGTIISILLTFGAAKQAIMKTVLKASETPLLLLYGFFMNAVIGYMGDQGFGKDDGYSLKKIVEMMDIKDNKIKGFGATLKYIFGSLATYEFWRYIITVFLDMFISMPLQSIIVSVTENLINNLKYNIPFIWSPLQPVMNVLIKNYDNILQSFVGFITFLAYTNDTRFTWAYPGNDIDASRLISTGTIKLATAIAAIVYLIASVGADFNIVDGVKLKAGTSLSDTLDRKLYFVLITIFLLTSGSMEETRLNGTVVPIFNFMNYSPSRYQIAPIENYKTDTYWGIDKMKQKDINQLIKNPNCKFSNFKICQTDNTTGDLKLKTDKSNLELINEYRQLKQDCYDKYDDDDNSNPNSINKGIIKTPGIMDFNKRHNNKVVFIISLCAAILCILLIVLIVIFIGYKNYGSVLTRYIFGFIFIFLLGCLFISARFAMNKKESKSCSENTETDEEKLIRKFLIDYDKELKRHFNINKANLDTYTNETTGIKTQLFTKLNTFQITDDTNFDTDLEINNQPKLNLKTFLIENNSQEMATMGVNETDINSSNLFELFNRYTKSCIIVNKDMVSNCDILRKEIIKDLVDTYFKNNQDVIKFYIAQLENITESNIKEELIRVIETNVTIQNDINVLNDNEEFKKILETDFKIGGISILNDNEKLLDILSKMELRYNKNLGQLVKKIDMGIFMKPLNMIDTKYDVLEKSGLGFGILCFYCFIGYIVPFLPFIYGKHEKQNAAIWKVILMSVIVIGVLIFLFIISSQSPSSKDIKKQELNYLYEK